MGERKYFGVNPESNRIDAPMAAAETSCCGVNLAFCALWFSGWLVCVVFARWL